MSSRVNETGNVFLPGIARIFSHRFRFLLSLARQLSQYGWREWACVWIGRYWHMESRGVLCGTSLVYPISVQCQRQRVPIDTGMPITVHTVHEHSIVI